MIALNCGCQFPITMYVCIIEKIRGKLKSSFVYILFCLLYPLNLLLLHYNEGLVITILIIQNRPLICALLYPLTWNEQQQDYQKTVNWFNNQKTLKSVKRISTAFTVNQLNIVIITLNEALTYVVHSCSTNRNPTTEGVLLSLWIHMNMS